MKNKIFSLLMLNLLSGSSLSIKVSKQLDWWTWLSILASPQTIYFPIGRSDKVFGIAAPLRGLNLNNSTTGSSRWSINGALFRGTRSYSNLKKKYFWWKQYKYPECPPTMRYNQIITQFCYNAKCEWRTKLLDQLTKTKTKSLYEPDHCDCFGILRSDDELHGMRIRSLEWKKWMIFISHHMGVVECVCVPCTVILIWKNIFKCKK